MATGPSVRYEMLDKSPEYKESCIEHMTSVPRKKYSQFISDVMDHMGYSYKMVKLRQQMWGEYDSIRNIVSGDRFRRVTTGGKGEGTALMYESDTDMMAVLNDVICAENPQQFIHNERITLFQTDTKASPPGYTTLKLIKNECVTRANEITQSLFEFENGLIYISSSIFISAMKYIIQEANREIGLNSEPISGPSTPIANKYVSIDSVVCFRCYCPDTLEMWIARPRHHGWPSPDTIRHISQLDGHVVPVGSKGSENMYTQWRICYSYAELYLMQNLNETQLKVYIILKKIAKSVLKPVCGDMTSYIMKNILLWICESNGDDKFKPELLIDRLFDCLIYLRKCIIHGYLPSYMISKRNLLDGRIGIQHREEMTNLLSDLLNEGESLLLRCRKISEGMLLMYTCPDIYKEFGDRRDEVEMLVLMMIRIIEQTIEPGMSREERDQLIVRNVEYMDIQAHIHRLIQIDIQTLRQNGYTGSEIADMVEQQISELLS